MRRTALLLCALLLLACKDPFEFEPGDPTKPDPPGPPVLLRPADGQNTYNYGYPQDVEFAWRGLPGATFYQVEAYSDSGLVGIVASNMRVAATSTTLTFNRWGFYYWRVRAASRNWNDYTAWSAPFMVLLPAPGDGP